MSVQIDSMNTMVLDVLKEIGNIGAGNAATALAKMIDKKVDMKVPKVTVMDVEEVPEMLGGEEVEVCGIFFRIDGDMDGSIMFLLTLDAAKTLMHLMMPGMGTGEIDEFAVSALSEIGNILAGSYISSLSGLTSLNIKISTPALALDMAGAILSVPAVQFGLVGDKILIIQNEFIECQENESVEGYFFLIPEVDSYDTLLRSIGIEI